MIRLLLRSTAILSLPVITLVAIWFSVIDHYHVSNRGITDDLAEQSRRVPEDALLEELNSFYFMGTLDALDASRTLEAATRILQQGEFAVPGSDPQKVGLPFDPRDLDRGPAVWQLQQASLFVPRLLVKAYRVSGREEFFLAARDVMLAWAAYEDRALLPKGSLWNDHAISERALALADFWAVYRSHPSYQANAGAEVLAFAARTGSFLVDPSQFTVSTNHGVMQNLALWHLGLAFPLLPESARYRRVATERLLEQMDFFLDSDGVILEHSAGYQLAGVQFLGMAFRYMSLQGIDVPSDWQKRYERAQDFLEQLRRPDGSLPMFGDTSDGGDPKGPPVTKRDAGGGYGPLANRADWSAPRPRSWYPTAGYSIWWDGVHAWPDSRNISQTVVAWSYFPGHAHKHADEGSVLLWANGETWWTNVGYWPYGTAGRDESESWTGSNATHLSGEPYQSERATRVLARGAAEGLTMIGLERTGPGGYTARRQIVHVGQTLWLVIDQTSGAPQSESQTVWTTSQGVEIQDGRIPGSFELTSGATETMLTKFILNSPGTRIQRARGSKANFLGWQVASGVPRPASAIVVEQPADGSFAVAVWSLDDGRPETRKFTSPPSVVSWKGPEQWTIALPLESGSVQLSRESDRVSLADADAKGSSQLILSSPGPVDAQRAAIRDAHLKALVTYPGFSDHIDYRLKATYMCCLVLFLQEAFLAAYRRHPRRHYTLLRGLSLLAWVPLGIWIVLIRTPLITY